MAVQTEWFCALLDTACLGPWIGNELAPTGDEIRAWCDTTSEVIEATERAWRG